MKARAICTNMFFFSCHPEMAKILVMWNFYISETYNVIISQHSFFEGGGLVFRSQHFIHLNIRPDPRLCVGFFLLILTVRFQNTAKSFKPSFLGSPISRKRPSMLVLLPMVLFSSLHTIWIIYLCNCSPVLKCKLIARAAVAKVQKNVKNQDLSLMPYDRPRLKTKSFFFPTKFWFHSNYQRLLLFAFLIWCLCPSGFPLNYTKDAQL